MKKYSLTESIELKDLNQFEDIKIKRDGNITVLPTVENIQRLLGHYNIEVKYNYIKKDTDIIHSMFDFCKDTEKKNSVNIIKNLCIKNNIDYKPLAGHLQHIASMNAYNPVLDFINSKEWDGKDRTKQFINNVVVKKEHEKLRNLYINKWLKSCVGMLYNGVDGNTFATEGILVFQGTQGQGKTSWLKSLLPREQREYLQDGLQLNLSDKDSVITALEHWIVELGEIGGTFNKSEIEALKAFATQGVNKQRRAYGITNDYFYRRTVFFATVNDTEFLSDITGNRRFWCLPIVELKKNDIDMQQLWAQVHHNLISNGLDAAQWHITNESEQKARDELNSEFTITYNEEEALSQVFDRSVEPMYLATCTAIQEYINSNLNIKISKRMLAKFLQRNYKMHRTAKGRFYMMPRPNNAYMRVDDNPAFKLINKF